MELWIRSKDKKELIRTNRIYQFAGVIYAEAKEEVELGNYKTRERALEILNEIQDLINDISDGKMVGCVYEMPEE